MKIVNYTVLSVAFLGLFSCTKKVDDPGVEYAPAMYHSRAYEPLTQVTDEQNDYYNSNPNNPYKMNMRLLPKNTIKISNFNCNYDVNSSGSINMYKLSKDSVGMAKAELLKNPIAKSDAVIEEGKELYGRYCQHCHGENGKADGPVAAVFGGVPRYAAVKDRNEGSIFYTITNGRNRMGAHGSQVSVNDRWKIVHYVQTLQNQ
jgi:cytochrome c5